MNDKARAVIGENDLPFTRGRSLDVAEFPAGGEADLLAQRTLAIHLVAGTGGNDVTGAGDEEHRVGGGIGGSSHRRCGDGLPGQAVKELVETVRRRGHGSFDDRPMLLDRGALVGENVRPPAAAGAMADAGKADLAQGVYERKRGGLFFFISLQRRPAPDDEPGFLHGL